ncbi:MAG: bifunctional adenosylcobinamide kinase/adenosylcobinamide-phosphate guanylyltransferase [Rubrimonas sp.]
MSDRWSRAFVIGGARSGKSRYAEMLAEAFSEELIYLATAEVRDREMADRVAAHKARRSGQWRTVEAPVALPESIAEVSKPGSIVLVDCLTLWLSNVMLSGASVDDAQHRLMAAMSAAPGRMVLVSNEVGLGIVPDNALARRFRDAQGRLNQNVASNADLVVFMAAGLPLYLKGAALAS